MRLRILDELLEAGLLSLVLLRDVLWVGHVVDS